ncbi:MAG TPA: DUF4258 domain-containing protein [Alphaproteobacteria bacterium]|jgi:hypothetical protein|nr:DUF4258 domain-containing protein [Alphaproteobacteria bacterium]
MQTIFSDHALTRIKERHISKLKVYATIKNPQEKLASFKDRAIYRRKFGSKTLEVIAKQENKFIVVISAYMIK